MRRNRWVVLVATAALVTLAMGTAARAASPEAPSATPAATPAPIGEACVKAERPFDAGDVHLTGTWGASDGAVWYIRHVGSDVFLLGMSDRHLAPTSLGRDWTSVAMGTLQDDLTIPLDFAQVPRGSWLDAGSLAVQVGADANGSLRISSADAGLVLWPCEPAIRLASGFFRPFEFRDEPFIGLWLWEGEASIAAIHPGFSSEDFWLQGMTVWHLGEDSASTCDGPGPTLAPGSAAFLEWLRTRTDIEVSQATPVTVDGHAATSVDVTVASGAATCLPGELETAPPRIRLARAGLADMALQPGSTSRLVALDLGSDTIVFEIWGPHQDVWLPLAQRVLDTVHFVE
jgi:hypothetical protein